MLTLKPDYQIIQPYDYLKELLFLQQALTSFEQALQLNPDGVEILYNKAVAYYGI